MTPPIIEVNGLGKQYRLGKIGPTRFVDDVDRWWRRIRGKEAAPEKGDFWALEDVSFSVHPGEIVGIIGRNGAGKSTLLKLLSRITEPTRGEILLRGRTASLLEIGTGFVGDLSGRENVFLNGAIMGLTRTEIRSRMDEIVGFAEVEKYIDTPVKRYSSGMFVRLAFSVAAHLDPDILIVDEVLAVGDLEFQKKCLGRLGDASREGRTVLFVSHNMTAIQSLCTRGILLRGGRVEADDDVSTVVAHYVDETLEKQNEQLWETPDQAPGNDLVRIRSIRIHSPDEPGRDRLPMRREIRVDTEFWLLGDHEHYIAYHIVNDEDIVVCTTTCEPAKREAGLYRASFVIQGGFLNAGGYSLKLWIVEKGGRPTHFEDHIAGFVVHDEKAEKSGRFMRRPGVVLGRFLWDVERIGRTEATLGSGSSPREEGAG